MNESPLLIHVWDVDPDEEATAVRSLDAMLGQLVGEPGFVSARILQSADRTSIATLVEMRTVQDRQRIQELPIVRNTLHELEGTANIVFRLYHQVVEYHL
jgi:hypothetical protein